MSRDILSEYGPDSPSPQAARLTRNGPEPHRDVRNYQPPVGPMGISKEGPGLGGNNYGNCGTQQRSSIAPRESGMPGISHNGSHHGHGTNRKG